MLRGVCAPRPPSFRAIEHLTRRPYPPVQTGPRALQADATDRKRVRFAQLAHGDVLRCPFPMPGNSPAVPRIHAGCGPRRGSEGPQRGRLRVRAMLSPAPAEHQSW
jgi:hypothetical protein